MSRGLTVALAAAMLAAAGCGGESSRVQLDEAHELVIVGGETREDGELGGYAVEGQEIASDPGPTIRVQTGRPVTIRFENVHGRFHDESIPHDFVIVADKDVGVALQPGDALWGAQTAVIYPEDDPDVITFTPDSPGTYYYICSVAGHVARGMWGRFVVEPGS